MARNHLHKLLAKGSIRCEICFLGYRTSLCGKERGKIENAGNDDLTGFPDWCRVNAVHLTEDCII